MKVLQVSYSLISGGAERFVVDLSNELSKKHEVHLLSILDDGEGDNGFYKRDIENDVKYHCAKEKKGITIKKVINLYKIIKQISPDIVHLHGASIIFFFLPAVLFFRKPKYIETLHNKAEYIFSLHRLSFLAIILYKLNLVKLCTISNENKRSLEEHTKILNSPLVYNGRKLPVCGNDIYSIKEKFDGLKKKEALVFIHIARFDPAKNQEMLIRVFNKIYKKGLDHILIILGRGFDSIEGKKIKAMANPNIYFMGTVHNVTDYLYCSDAFCLSSLYEGMPITLIEAMACKCIPLATPVSGVIDVVKDNETGFISEDFSEQAYFETIQRFIEKKNTIKRAKLRETFEEFFSIEKCANKYIDVYRQVLR